MKKKRTKRIMFLFIVTLLLLLLVKCSKNFNTSNPISHEINKTINDSKKSIDETEPTGEGSKDEEAEKATESNKNNTSSENKLKSSGTSNKNNSNSNKGSSNKPSSGSSNKNNGNNSSSNLNSNKGGSSSSSSNTGSSSKPSSGSNSKPSHTHTWVNVTKTVNHPAVTHQEDVYENRQVKVKDAWDEQVKTGTAQECRQCGFRTTDGDAMTEHMLENGHSCHTVYTYETVHHDAVYKTQRVKVGTRTVTDRAAWTETVVIDQKCSSCGKRK